MTLAPPTIWFRKRHASAASASTPRMREKSRSLLRSTWRECSAVLGFWELVLGPGTQSPRSDTEDPTPRLSGAPGGKQFQDLAQPRADVLDFSRRLRGEWNRGLPFFGFRLGAKLLARTHDGESL